MNEIPIYDVFVDFDDEELGVDKISFVKRPAIQVDFIYMSEDESIYKKVKLQDEKQIIVGPALIPNLEIIRKDDDGTPFYIKYTAEEIEKISQKFFREKDQYSVNKDHKNVMAEKTYIYESWLVGENDKSKDLGFDLPKGTWMITLKVEDDELWEQIKSGKYKGFSIEGLFRFKRVATKIEQKKWRANNIKSSNVDRILYQDETRELTVKFNTGEIYTYSDIDFAEFNSVVQGLAACRTEGSNKWGEWFVGKTPSVGAAVWQYLIDRNKPYRKGGTLQEMVILRDQLVALGEQVEVDLANMDDLTKYLQSRYTAGELQLLLSTLWRLRRLIKMEAEVELVKPNAGEGEDDFIGRCMSELEGEYPDRDQRLAVCYTYWENKTNLEGDTKNKNVNMVSTILKNGATLYTDAETFDVGSEVYLLDGENKVAAPAGEHEFEDGTVIVVDENSVITEIKAAEGSEEPASEEDVEAEEVYDVASQFEALKGMLENLNLKIDKLLGEEGLLQSVEQSVKDIEVKLEKISLSKEIADTKSVDEVVNTKKTNRLDYNLITKLNKKF